MQNRSHHRARRQRRTRRPLRYARPLRYELLENRRVLATIVVNSTDDVDDGSADAIHTSLREAIIVANMLPGHDTIAFNIPGPGPHTIQPTSALPVLSDSALIDGYTQPGASPNTNGPTQGTNAVLKIELDGSNAPGAIGINVGVSDCTIRGLVVNRFDTHAIHIYSGTQFPAINTLIEGSFIGTDVTGTIGLGNGANVQGKAAISIAGPNNLIGGSTPAARNLISGNTGTGVEIGGVPSNTIQGNLIGTDATGTKALPNGGDGVAAPFSSSNRIGGTTPGERNVISGNSGYNVSLAGGGNFVTGNYIGTDVTGTFGLVPVIDQEFRPGIFIYGNAANVIGGTAPGSGNLISGHQIGIDIRSPANIVQGNFIGTNHSGTAAIPNLVGVQIVENGRNNLIGGPSALAGNLISGNTNYGIEIYSSTASGNQVFGNRIGTNIAQTSPVPNGVGIRIYAGSSNNTIGSSQPGEANIIAYSGAAFLGSGVILFHDAGSGNRIQGNQIYSNKGFGIDIAPPEGARNFNDLGDADVGPNGLQNYPALALAEAGAFTRVRGTLNSQPNKTFTIDLYANSVADSSGFGEGERYLGSTSVQTDASGNVIFDVQLAAQTALGEYVTATATEEPVGNTSEFSAARLISNFNIAKFTINNATVNEADGTATFTVSLDRPLDIPVDVKISYADGNTSAGDFDHSVDTVTFAVGDTADKLVTVAINDDNAVEVIETFTASLAISPATPVAPRMVDVSDTGTGTILDNDTAIFSINDVTVNEGAGTATFTVSLDKPLPVPLDVIVSYTDGGTSAGDFDHASDTVSFAAGDNANKMVTVAITDDNLVEVLEMFLASLAISPATPINSSVVDVTDTGTGTITDNDTATFTIADVTVNEAAGTAMFTVSLDKPLDVPVSVNVSYADVTTSAGDFDHAIDTVSFAAGDNTGKMVAVAITDDDLVENIERFTASLAINVATPVGARMVNVSDTATGTITDNDVAVFMIDDVTVSEGDGTATFTVSLNKPLDIPVIVNVGYSNINTSSDDFDHTTDSVNFAAGDTASKMVTVAINENNIVEPIEMFTASMAISGATPTAGRAIDTSDTGTGTINDNDTARLTINDVTVNEGAGTATFTVSLDRPLDVAVNVNVSYSDVTTTAGDFDHATDTVSFGTGDTANKTVTVAIVNDNVVEATETFVANLAISAATPIGSRMVDLSDTGTGTITDNDAAVVTINNVAVSESAGTATFTLSLDRPLDIPLDVHVGYSDLSTVAGDFDHATDIVSFPAGDTTNKFVSVVITDDEFVEETETFTASLSISPATPIGTRMVNTGDTGTGTINDNDEAVFTINDVTVNEGAGTATFTLSLSKALEVPVTVNVSYADLSTSPSDFDHATDSIVFAAGDNADKAVVVAITDDNVVENPERFTASLAISPATPVGSRMVTASDTGIGAIIDNDTAVFAINDVVVSEADGTATFTVTLSNPLDIPVLVNVSYSDVNTSAGDFDHTIDTVSFAAGDSAGKTVVVAITDDDMPEPTETFLASLSISGATPPAGRATDVSDTGTGTINDNDTPELVGDYDQSGTVDASDYVVWRKTSGQAVTPFTGADGDGNGLVDQADYELWRANFGRTAPMGSGTAASDGGLSDATSLITSTPIAEPDSFVDASTGSTIGDSILQWLPVDGSVRTSATHSRAARLLTRGAYVVDASADEVLVTWVASNPANPARDGNTSWFDEDSEALVSDQFASSSDAVDTAFALL